MKKTFIEFIEEAIKTDNCLLQILTVTDEFVTANFLKLSELSKEHEQYLKAGDRLESPITIYRNAHRFWVDKTDSVLIDNFFYSINPKA